MVEVVDIQALKDKLSGRRVVASVSGGKDSAAMSLHLTELGIEHDRVFLDTGWEHEKTYDYLRGPLADKVGPIHELRSPLLMEDLIRKKGMFPSRLRRFCTQELKVKPLYAYLNSRVAAGEDVVSTVGIRRAESKARSQMPEWEDSEGLDCEVWRPLILWTEDDVIAIHKRHNLRPNPLYLMGAQRVGCWPCIFSRKEEIRLIAERDPRRIDRIRSMESDVTATMTARVEARGEVMGPPPSFFQARTPSEDGTRAFEPIDSVVAWSKTTRGGRELDMFPMPEDEGCMRWGLCDTAPDTPAEVTDGGRA